MRKIKTKQIDFFLMILILCFSTPESEAIFVRKIDLSPINVEENEEVSISGTVTDPSGDPLIGVTVQIKGTGTGTATDFDGTYSLEKVDEDAILVFSYKIGRASCREG